MSETWLLVEVEDSALDAKPLSGTILRYIVSPGLYVKAEKKSPGEVLQLASDQGFDVRYRSMGYPGISPKAWERAELSVLAAVQGEIGVEFGRWDISISPVASMTRRR